MRTVQERGRYIAQLLRDRSVVFCNHSTAKGEEKARLWIEWQRFTKEIERAQDPRNSAAQGLLFSEVRA